MQLWWGVLVGIPLVVRCLHPAESVRVATLHTIQLQLVLRLRFLCNRKPFCRTHCLEIKLW